MQICIDTKINVDFWKNKLYENKKREKANNTYYILKKTEVPTVIVECGFLSNHKEAEKLSDEAYQGKIAEAVVKGIKSFFLK